MKIILFDIDETLLTCKEANIVSSRAMFRQVFNIDAHEKSVSNMGRTEKGIIEEIVRLYKHYPKDQEIDIPNLAYQTWAEAAVPFLKKHPPRVLPNVVKLLNSLCVSGVLMGLLTGNSRLRAEVKLQAAGLAKYFEDQERVLRGVFGDTSSKRFDLVNKAKVKFGDGTYVILDDSLIAAKAAKDAGITAILVATGEASEEELKEYSKYVFSDFGEDRWERVVEIIQSLE